MPIPNISKNCAGVGHVGGRSASGGSGGADGSRGDHGGRRNVSFSALNTQSQPVFQPVFQPVSQQASLSNNDIERLKRDNEFLKKQIQQMQMQQMQQQYVGACVAGRQQQPGQTGRARVKINVSGSLSTNASVSATDISADIMRQVPQGTGDERVRSVLQKYLTGDMLNLFVFLLNANKSRWALQAVLHCLISDKTLSDEVGISVLSVLAPCPGIYDIRDISNIKGKIISMTTVIHEYCMNTPFIKSRADKCTIRTKTGNISLPKTAYEMITIVLNELGL